VATDGRFGKPSPDENCLLRDHRASWSRSLAAPMPSPWIELLGLHASAVRAEAARRGGEVRCIRHRVEPADTPMGLDLRALMRLLPPARRSVLCSERTNNFSEYAGRMTVRQRVSRWLFRVKTIYEREVLAEEGYRLGLIWTPVAGLVPESVPDAPGVLVMASPDRSIQSVAPAISLRARFRLSATDDVGLVALIETGDYASARWLSDRLREEAAVKGR
jgi:hypothetical protein